MKIYTNENNKLVEAESFSESIVWIDLLSPTSEEKKSVEKFLDISIPTEEQMKEIESSSRLYKEDNALFMTFNVVKKTDSTYKLVNDTFILKNNVLVTLRYEDAGAITNFLKVPLHKPSYENGLSILLGILEIIVDRIADTLEIINSTIEMLSSITFKEKRRKSDSLSRILVKMGQQGEINSKARESLSGLTRLIGFLRFNVPRQEDNRFESLTIDTSDLKDHSTFLGQKISFMLDANLGLIQIEQNNIIKIFSVAAVVFLPPTLIASIYGMNFRTMPELNWVFGYPYAIILMIISATLPYLYFKKKGWL